MPRVRLAQAVLTLCACLLSAPVSAQDVPPQPDAAPVLKELIVKGASIFGRDDVLWLLHMRIGERLPGTPDRVAELLQEQYAHEGFEAAEVHASYDPGAGRLTLDVEEGQIDGIEITGLRTSRAEAFRARLEARGIRTGIVYNERDVYRVVNGLLAETEGALRVGSGGIDLVARGDRRVLVVPISREHFRFSLGSSTVAREDFFSPVDGFAPGLSFEALRFDHSRFNHTFIGGHLAYKFGPEEPGFSIGFEQGLLRTPRVSAGAEAHDITTSDDLWRISSTEQSLVSLTFKNTFRDYYRRRGMQVFGAVRPGSHHEMVASLRKDRHESLDNETDYSFFRDAHPYRQNLPISGGNIHALVLAYTFDGRGLTPAGAARSFDRHLINDLFRDVKVQDFGVRLDWTSEIAGHGFGGDYSFRRHVLNARAYVPLMPRQSVTGRVIQGFSDGDLPIERRFSVGGLGTVRGYAFKEAVGERMTLVNLEYRLDLTGDWYGNRRGSLRALFLFDAGHVGEPIAGSTTRWLKGVGAGLQTGPIRVEFGFRLNDVPASRQILVRLGPTF